MPLLYPEIVDIIIDKIAADICLETRGWLNGPMYGNICREPDHKGIYGSRKTSSRATLKKCSLISRTWYPRSSQYLWRVVTFDGNRPDIVLGLVRFLTKRPDIVGLIKHVDLHVSWDHYPELNNRVDALARILSPMSTLSLIYPPGRRAEEDARQDEGGELPSPLFRALTLPFTLVSLTSLHYEGQTFPGMLLEHTPNLRDLSLQGPAWPGHYRIDINYPMMWSDQVLENSASSTFSFRLQRAHFSTVTKELVDNFVKYHPQVFSRIKELYLAHFVRECYRGSIPEAGDLPGLRLLMSTRNTLEKLAIGINRVRRSTCFCSSPPSQTKLTVRKSSRRIILAQR